MTTERLNSAFGRTPNKELIHTDCFSDNRVCLTKDYPKEVYLDTSPGSFGCKNVSFYTVWHDGELMCLGSSEDEDAYHEWLRMSVHNDIDLKLHGDEPTRFENWCELESYEIECVQKGLYD
eukprot:4482002-Amphidinium_carterae.2